MKNGTKINLSQQQQKPHITASTAISFVLDREGIEVVDNFFILQLIIITK